MPMRMDRKKKREETNEAEKPAGPLIPSGDEALELREEDLEASETDEDEGMGDAKIGTGSEKDVR